MAVDAAGDSGNAGPKSRNLAVALSAGGSSDRGLRLKGRTGESGPDGRSGYCQHGRAALVSLFFAQSARTDADGAATARWR